MKIRYFDDTSARRIELRSGSVAATRDLSDNSLADVDDAGQMISITIEHVQARAELPIFSYEQIAA